MKNILNWCLFCSCPGKSLQVFAGLPSVSFSIGRPQRCMSQKPTLKRPEPLTAAIIADMKPGDERGDAQCAGLRVRYQTSRKKVFFYRYRAQDNALREIRLGEVGLLTLVKARDAAMRKRLERDQGKDLQLEKRQKREQAVELLKYCQAMDKVFVFSSPRADQHVAQKALGLAQYTARHAKGDKPVDDPIERYRGLFTIFAARSQGWQNSAVLAWYRTVFSTTSIIPSVPSTIRIAMTRRHMSGYRNGSIILTCSLCAM